jgi:hypothetical protein
MAAARAAAAADSGDEKLLAELFEAAAGCVENLIATFSDDVKLQFYGLYKQAGPRMVESS